MPRSASRFLKSRRLRLDALGGLVIKLHRLTLPEIAATAAGTFHSPCVPVGCGVKNEHHNQPARYGRKAKDWSVPTTSLSRPCFHASARRAEGWHCRTRANKADWPQPFAISKNMPFQWRKKGGRYPVGKRSSRLRARHGKRENQMIVTRERTRYGRPIESILRLASFADGPSETNNT